MSNKGSGAAALVLVGALVLYASIDLSEPQKKFAADWQSKNPATFYANACDEMDRCVRYGHARHDCAAAGNIDECVSIKTNGLSGAYCSDDGKNTGIPEQVSPTLLQCFAFRAERHLEQSDRPTEIPK